MTCQYPNDLPQEVDKWMAKCFRCNLEFVNTLTDPISYIDLDLYPNVHMILKLLLTLPVGSCACERSFSALRCLKTWCRATMTEVCLCGLAMLHVHRNDTVRQVNPESHSQKSWVILLMNIHKPNRVIYDVSK